MKKILTSMFIFASAVSLQAASVTITNNDFDAAGGLPADNGWNNATPTGWTKTGTIGLQDIDSGVGTTDYVVFLQSGGLLQDISADAVLGGAVAIGDVFSVDILATNQNAAPDIVFDIQDAFGASLIGGAQTVTGITGGGTYTTVTGMGTIDTASSDIFLSLSRVGGQVRMNGVSLDYAAVPEPSSTALLGLGGLALILRRKK